MILTKRILKEMVTMVAMTLPDEIACDRCFQEMDRFAEIYLAGKDAEEAMPLIHQHLERCPCCMAEFEALIEALRALGVETAQTS